MEWTEVIIAIIGSGILTAIVNAIFDRRRRHAEAGKTFAEGDEAIARADQIRQLIEAQQWEGALKEMTRLQEQLGVKQEELAGAVARIDQLEADVAALQQRLTVRDSRVDELERIEAEQSAEIRALRHENTELRAESEKLSQALAVERERRQELEALVERLRAKLHKEEAAPGAEGPAMADPPQDETGQEGR